MTSPVPQPMFPLQSALLPGEVLPLRIFEPRYAQLVQDCLAMTEPAFGVVLTAGYILWMIQRVYLGPERDEYKGYPDVTAREVGILTPMAILAIFMGILQGYTFQLMNGTLDSVLQAMGVAGKAIAAATIGG